MRYRYRLSLLLLGVVGVSSAAEAAPEEPGNRPPIPPMRRSLRVLLFAGAPSYDYQFTQRMFTHLGNAQGAYLSVCVQGSDPKQKPFPNVQRHLSQLPDRLRTEKNDGESAEDRDRNFFNYDVIVAFDPDWTQVPGDTLGLLEKWVADQGGGLVIIPGPVNTYQLARKANHEKLKALRSLYPVEVGDSRIDDIERPGTHMFRLNFTEAASRYEFMRLDERGGAPLAGWETFFTAGAEPEAKGTPAKRGFHSAYPVKAVKPTAEVLATYADPTTKGSDGKERPYLVAMAHGKGRVLYMGSGETRRLHEKDRFRFWIGMCLHAGAEALSTTAAGLPAVKPPEDLPEGDTTWRQLASPEPTTAYVAMWKLQAANPKDALPFLAKRLAAVPDDDVHERIARHILELDSDKFDVRKRAADALERIGPLALPALLRALEGKPSLDLRQRLDRLVTLLEKHPATPDEVLRARRALAVLEAINTAEARQTVKGLAGGAPKFWLTKMAAGFHARMEKQPERKQ